MVCAVASRVTGDRPAGMFELVDQAKANTEEAHEAVMADPAFCDFAALQKAEEEREVKCFLPDARMQSE